MTFGDLHPTRMRALSVPTEEFKSLLPLQPLPQNDVIHHLLWYMHLSLMNISLLTLLCVSRHTSSGQQNVQPHLNRLSTLHVYAAPLHYRYTLFPSARQTHSAVWRPSITTLRSRKQITSGATACACDQDPTSIMHTPPHYHANDILYRH